MEVEVVQWLQGLEERKMTIRKERNVLVIRARGSASEKAKVKRLVETLKAPPTHGEVQTPEPIEFPDRPSLT
jgi:hypothetical protein